MKAIKTVRDRLPKRVTLVTHPRPHTDDIAGFWLFRRYLPECARSPFRFVSSKEKDPGRANEIWVGVGRGRFDEHKGDIGECAATLVYKYVQERRPDLSDAERRALDRLVAWVRDEDTGLHDLDRDREFGVMSILRSYFDAHKHDSKELTRFGLEILDGIFASLLSTERLAEDWERRVEFESPWGRAVGLETAAYGADDYAYTKGYQLLVLVNPERGFRHFRASAKSTADLSEAYETLMRLDPKSDWFLHHSKKLLLSGSDVAPDSKKSKLGLRDLIRVLQPIGE